MSKLQELYRKQYVAEPETQYLLFDSAAQLKNTPILNIDKTYCYPKESFIPGFFQIQNRRYLGNKYKLTAFIGDIIAEKCGAFESLCDIFAGTGVVGYHFNRKNIQIVSNDILYGNYAVLKTFLGVSEIDLNKVKEKIRLLNSLNVTDENYFSVNFGNRYFTLENARKIGAIREKIEKIAETESEKVFLLTSLIYAVDKIANTVGHYDAFRKKLDATTPLFLLMPNCKPENNCNNEVYREDANRLIKKIACDILYIDPPYNSRQYCDAYHLLENLACWEKPAVYGVAKKMDRGNLKSEYCLKSASRAFAELIGHAKCKHILMSYNNTRESKDCRSNARIKDSEIVRVLKRKGEIHVFERNYKAFTTGKSIIDGHTERIFYCKVSR